MYSYLILFHSWFRWFVIILAIISIFYLLKIPLTKTSNHQKLLWLYDQFFGYQFLIGSTMWLTFSPMAKVVFNDWSLVFENYTYFFWGVQHPLTMFIALGVWHAFQAKGRRTGLAKNYFKGILFSLFLIATAIPWPWLGHGRDWFRWSL
ncbi:MAG: hypothetical protein AAF518_26940 [Spirochaetota bacterium]